LQVGDVVGGEAAFEGLVCEHPYNRPPTVSSTAAS
jgi:hypothetical protein